MTKSCEKALFDVFRQLMLFDIFWWALGINLIAPFLADIGFHVPDNDHPFQLWESPWCEQQRLKSMHIDCNVNLNYSAQQIAYWEDLFPKNWDDRTKLICKGCNFWIIKWASYFITRSHSKTLGTSFLTFVPKRPMGTLIFWRKTYKSQDLRWQHAIWTQLNSHSANWTNCSPARCIDGYIHTQGCINCSILPFGM